MTADTHGVERSRGRARRPVTHAIAELSFARVRRDAIERLSEHEVRWRALGALCGWVLAHHERPDGEGYPVGLLGDEIPVEARILAVADAFEAMTAERVYSPPLPVAMAIGELQRNAGTQFDIEVVETFVSRLAVESGQQPLVAAAG